MSLVRKSAVPENALATHALSPVTYADAYVVRAPEGMSPEDYARAMFANPPGWIKFLTELRDRIVSLVGLKKAKHMIGDGVTRKRGENARSPLKVLAADNDQLLFGVDDRHLDFRVSIQRMGTPAEFCVVTAVKLHNWLGRLYFLPVKPLHRIIVPAMMRRAASL
ncbi:MAG TPA: DUF2867 domain-containing protein [Rhizomicrobium sp.]|jgi:hypothetical protein|nr:DUF2867 domain-containing protein [Rhizomicrobium sp.]